MAICPIRRIPATSRYLQAIAAYQASKAGLVNAQNAIEFALAKIPAVDPQRLYTAGHSSAACQALLLAEKDPRIRACIAYAPVVDVAKQSSENLPIYRTIDQKLRLAPGRFVAQSKRVPFALSRVSVPCPGR